MANLTVRIGTLNNNGKNRNYVYRDMNSNLLLNSNKTDVITNDDVNAVFGSIKNIFDYKPGERILEPEFGMNFGGLLYEPMSEKTANSLGLLIHNTLKRWETRINLGNIDIIPDYDDNTYYITINFTIKSIANKNNYKFNYALRRSL